MSSVPSYIPIPGSAVPIGSPAAPTSPKAAPIEVSSFPPTSHTLPSSTSTREFAVPTATSITTNVSDLLLSSLLPPNLPKLPQGSSRPGGPGRPRELSTQREQLSLPLVSNNFRRFVTKVGPLFWLQDRIEEILFWRKPVWTWAWLLAWTCISFKPRLLLVTPSLVLIILLLHIHERSAPTSSLLGIPGQAQAAGTVRMSNNNSNTPTSSGSYSASTGPDGETIPVVPPREAESSVDYYMNLQAIQNLMGLVSDMYDQVAPRLALLTSSAPTPTSLNSTSFPLTPSHLILLLLLPSICLPLLPPFAIPYLLLPIGVVPPMFFHPVIAPLISSLPRSTSLLHIRAVLENLVLTDALSDELGHREIGRVEVWENERLDPSVASKPPSSLSTVASGNGSVALPTGAWSARHLRAGERAPWVKVLSPSVTDNSFPAMWDQSSRSRNSTTLWRIAEGGGLVDMRDHSMAITNEKSKDGDKDGEKIVLALKEGWSFIPQEDWRVDVCGLWSDVGSDTDGWVYSDDSWQNPSPTAVTDPEPAALQAGATAMPALTLRRVTRRRRWWRRVSHRQESSSANRPL